MPPPSSAPLFAPPLFAPPSGLPAALPSTALAQVLVTAADPAGLVLAVDLARHGVDAVILGGPPSSGEAAAAGDVVPLDAASQELLDDLGVLDRLIATAPRGRASSVMSAFEPLEVALGVLLSVLHERLIELGGGIHRDHTYLSNQPDGARLDCYVDGPAGPITIRSFFLVHTDAVASRPADERVFVIASAPDEIGRRLEDAYNLGWKLAAVLRGAPGWILRTYHTERPAPGRARPSPSEPQPPTLSLPCLRPQPDGGGIAPGSGPPMRRCCPPRAAPAGPPDWRRCCTDRTGRCWATRSHPPSASRCTSRPEPDCTCTSSQDAANPMRRKPSAPSAISSTSRASCVGPTASPPETGY